MEENAINVRLLTRFSPHPLHLQKDGVLCLHVDYPAQYFTPAARDLLKRLFHPDPTKRLGAQSIDEIKSHTYFDGIDWDRLCARQVVPPFVPDSRTVNAQSIGEVGDLNRNKYRKIRLTPEDEAQYAEFDYRNVPAAQTEFVQALHKQQSSSSQSSQASSSSSTCCCCM